MFLLLLKVVVLNVEMLKLLLIVTELKHGKIKLRKIKKVSLLSSKLVGRVQSSSFFFLFFKKEEGE